MTCRSKLAGAALTLLLTPAALVAQNGNGSDVSGINVSGSNVAGGAFIPTFGATTPTPIPASGTTSNLPAISVPVPTPLVPLVTSLAAGTATLPPAPGGAAPPPIPAETGILVLQLAAGAPGGAATVSATSALLNQLGSGAGAPGAEALTNMLGTLAGVLASPTPANILAAVRAFNAALDQASGAYLASAPPALAAVSLLLNGMVSP
jgi:hypothetical protein